MRFYTVESLGNTRDATPEGYMLCRNVPIGRTGLLVYAPGEVPVSPGPRGLIEIERRAEEVFRQNTIDSFAAKPVCNDHPPTDINPENWKKYSVGVILDPRRGTDSEADLLIADLLITDADAIAAVEDGKVEVSCGYDADYIEHEPGRGEQRNIVGNHVALVDRGRCGPRCSIGDKAMAKRRTVWDRIRTAIKANDSEAIEEAIEEAQESLQPRDEEAETSSRPVEVHVHNYPQKADEDEKEPEVTDEAAEGDPMAEIAKFREEIAPVLTAIVERLDRLEAGEKAEAEANGMAEDEDMPEDETEDEEEDTTTDSGEVALAWRDAIAGAEIIAPGMKAPTFDTRDSSAPKALCVFRRKALDRASRSDEGRAAIAKVVPGKWNPKGMTCDAVQIAFANVVEHVRAANNSSMFRQISRPAEDKPFDMRQVNRDFWASRRA